MMTLVLVVSHLLVGVIMLTICDDDHVIEGWCDRVKRLRLLRLALAISLWPLFLWLRCTKRL
jgi:hypothetical protein